MKTFYLMIVRENNVEPRFTTYKNFLSAINYISVHYDEETIFEKIDWENEKATFETENLIINIIPID